MRVNVYIILRALISISIFLSSLVLIANNTNSPSDTYLDMAKSSIGASTSVQTISGSNTRGLTRTPGERGWGSGGPGGGTIIGGGGGVGGGPIDPPTPGPLGDFSMPMIIGIIATYFVVRGVSSKKKKIM